MKKAFLIAWIVISFSNMILQIGWGTRISSLTSGFSAGFAIVLYIMNNLFLEQKKIIEKQEQVILDQYKAMEVQSDLIHSQHTYIQSEINKN